MVCCDARLVALFERSFPQATIFGGEPGTQDWRRWSGLKADYQIPAASVARYLRDDIARFPAASGYLLSDRERQASWHARYGQLGDGLKVSHIKSVQHLFAALAFELDDKEFRLVNQRYWAQKIGVVQQTVSRALNCLCRDGVLERGPADGTGFTYRIHTKNAAFSTDY